MTACSDGLREDIFNELKSRKSDALSRYFDENPELKLYKYRSGAERDVNALKAGKVWMGCAAYMDDVYDSALIPKENWLKLYQYMCSKEPKFKEDRYARVMNSKGKIFQRDLYICSLAETAQNEDLWARYAGHHSGFCIEYSAKALIHAGRVPFPIYYGDINRSLMELNAKSKSDMLFDIILKKSAADWCQQGEWRLINWYSSLGINPGDKGSLTDVPTPTKVYCGKNASAELKESLLSASACINVPLVLDA